MFSWFTPWLFWVGSAICCLVIVCSLNAWRKRTREKPYPTALTTSATLTQIPLPPHTQPTKATPIATELSVAEGRSTTQVAGIQVTEHLL